MKKYIIIAVLSLAVVPTSIFAMANMKTSQEKPKQEKSKEKPKADSACVSTATGVREGKIIDAFSAFTTSMKSALETRKTALVAANANTCLLYTSPSPRD